MSIISFTCQIPHRCQIKCDIQSVIDVEPVNQRFFMMWKLKAQVIVRHCSGHITLQCLISHVHVQEDAISTSIMDNASLQCCHLKINFNHHIMEKSPSWYNILASNPDSVCRHIILDHSSFYIYLDFFSIEYFHWTSLLLIRDSSNRCSIWELPIYICHIIWNNLYQNKWSLFLGQLSNM